MINKRIKKSFGINYFVIALHLAIFFILFGFLILKSKFYQSQVYFLLLPQDNKTAFQINQVSNNLVTLINSLPFYQKNNTIVKQSKPIIQVSLLPNSSIIDLKVTTIGTVNNNQKIKREIIESFLQKTAFYYNANKELSVRIIKNQFPVVVHENYKVAVLLSFGLTLGFWLLFQFFLNSFLTLSKNFYQPFKNKLDWQPQKKNLFTHKFQRMKKSPKNKKSSELSEKKSEFISQSENQIPSSPVQKTIKKSHAPNNLPVVNNSMQAKTENHNSTVPENLPIGNLKNNLDTNFHQPEKNETRVDKIKLNSELTEPTEEEYKERLNQLLKGEL